MAKTKQQIETERKAIKAMIVGNVSKYTLVYRQHRRFGDVWGDGTWTLTFTERGGEDLSTDAFDAICTFMNQSKLKFEYITTTINGDRIIA